MGLHVLTLYCCAVNCTVNAEEKSTVGTFCMLLHRECYILSVDNKLYNIIWAYNFTSVSLCIEDQLNGHQQRHQFHLEK